MNFRTSIIKISGLILCLIFLLPACLWAGVDVDRFNREIKPKEYYRIVSLAPNITEILFGLGLGDRIVGVTKHCNYPVEALTKTNVGSYIDLNIEKILSLNPDLVIATADGNEKGSVERLMDFRIPVLITNPRNLDEVFETVKIIGRVTKQEPRAEIMVHALKQRADRVIQSCLPLSRPRVFLQINEHPLITVGKDTFHNHLIKLAGGINISGNDTVKYPKYSLEQVLRSRPDILLITSMERGVLAERKKERWKQWGQIPAVKQGRIHILNSDLLDRPSPRLVDGLEALARAIHPELGEN
jgi:iron complex transport system substrate-binding protein